MGCGRLVVISAPSGTGKTTIVHQLLATIPTLVHSVSFTTRPPRSGEQPGRDYHFVDVPTFQAMVAAGAFVEWAKVHGRWYGTPRAPLEQWRANGLDIILDLDVQGARALRRAYPETIAIFIMPPSRQVLAQRLRQRGTEDRAALKRRLEKADREMASKEEYQYLLVNDALDTVCAEIRRIIRPETRAEL